MKSVSILLVISIFSVCVYAQEARDGFNYIWGNYHTNPYEISKLQPDEFEFDTLLNIWATGAVIRANLITNNSEGARFLFDHYLSDILDEIYINHFGTWVEIKSIEGFLLRKEYNYQKSDLVFDLVILETTQPGEIPNAVNEFAAQIGLAYFHKARNAHELAKRELIDTLYNQAYDWAKAANDELTQSDALTNNALYHAIIGENYSIAYDLLQTAQELNLESTQATLLINMTSANLLAFDQKDFDESLKLLSESREIAYEAKHFELWREMGMMMMRIEVFQEEYSTLQKKRNRDIAWMLGIILIGLINVWLFKYQWLNKSLSMSNTAHNHESRRDEFLKRLNL